MYTFWRAVALFCKGLASLKSCVEQLQFPHKKGSSSHLECLVQLFCLISCWFIFWWCILLHTRSCVFVYKYGLFELMLPIGHVPTQIYVNKTYIPHYNWLLFIFICRIHIFLYFLYVWISFNGFSIDSLENYQVFKQKPFPLFVKTHKFAQNNYFFMTSDVSDRKLNKENQICNF